MCGGPRDDYGETRVYARADNKRQTFYISRPLLIKQYELSADFSRACVTLPALLTALKCYSSNVKAVRKSSSTMHQNFDQWKSQRKLR